MAGTRFLTDFSYIFCIVLTISACLLAILLNIRVLIMIATTSHLRNKRFAFVSNLALTDLCVAFVVIGYVAFPEIVWVQASPSALLFASVFNIFAVAVDRSIALKWSPLQYNIKVTAPRCLMVCVGIWIVSFSIFLPVYHFFEFVNNIAYCVFPTVILSLLLITAINYTLVFHSVSSKNLDILGSKQLVMRQKQSRSILITFSLILGSSFVCWLPICVCFVVFYASNNTTELFGSALQYSLMLLALNSALNPAIFHCLVEVGRRHVVRSRLKLSV